MMSVRDNLQKQINESIKQLDFLVKQTKLPIIQDKSGNPLWIDVRELDLRYQMPIKKVQKFFNGLKEGKILTTRCQKCGTIYFPPQDDCPQCKLSGLEWIELPREGKLITYTKIYVKPPSFSHYQDYVVGIAKLDNGINITAWVVGNLEKLNVGADVKLEVEEREPEGYITYYLKIE
ncbi:3-hydroxybutyryl-CoA epimerase [Acidianus sp. HS-5]|nr:3-hydroxybutyryl-CoA epimerase [Acidianus sp. HS-5]